MGEGARTERRRALAAAATLVGLWFVPETWALGPNFTWEALGSAGPLALAAALSGPVCGALLLVLLLSPCPLSLRRWGGALLGAAALALPLLGPAPGVALPVALVLPAACGLSLAAALAFRRGRPTAAHLVLLVVPLAILTRFLVSAALGDLPIGYLSGLKAPVRIWAASLALVTTLSSYMSNDMRQVAGSD